MMTDAQQSSNEIVAAPIGSSSAAISAAVMSSPQHSQPEDADTGVVPMNDGAAVRRTTEQDEAIVSRIEDSLYQDYSQVTSQDVVAELAAAPPLRRAAAADIDAYLEGGSGSAIFPSKLHEMLSDPDAQGLVAWLPHGRAWRVLDADRFARSTLLSRHFRHGNYRSFMRQVSGWGFRRVERGRDSGAYYHQLFLRGMTHLCARMSRTAIKTRRGERRSIFSQLRGVTPDFYRISEQYPLPEVQGPAPVPALVPSASASSPAIRRRLLAHTPSLVRSAPVPDGATSSSSSLASSLVNVAGRGAGMPREVSIETVTSSQSFGSFASSATSGNRGGGGSPINADFSDLASGAMMAAAAGPRPDPVASLSLGASDVAPDSPTSVMSRSLVPPQPPSSNALSLAIGGNGAPGVLQLANDSEVALRRLTAVSTIARGNSPSALATAALQRYIAANAVNHHRRPQQPANEQLPHPVSSNSSVVGAPSGGDALAPGGSGGREVFLRRLRERADLIESLRSIMEQRR
mmetsp:Transcript_18662/g.53805  ORF Transcript_18662/g.53805 Transcript_18662/m.53805 type:complete len:518 (-) Transcript_18662:295-1848(-)